MKSSASVLFRGAYVNLADGGCDVIYGVLIPEWHCHERLQFKGKFGIRSGPNATAILQAVFSLLMGVLGNFVVGTIECTGDGYIYLLLSRLTSWS